MLGVGADILAKDELGWTALASANGLVVVKILLDAGSDISSINSGRTPLGHAAFNGHIEVVSMLLNTK